ncbi:MAG: hypothetical protein ACLQU5_19140 [Isosphaeraceae bacterium]
MNQKHSCDGGGKGPSLGVQGAMIRLAVSAVDDEWSDTFGMICCPPDEHFTRVCERGTTWGRTRWVQINPATRFVGRGIHLRWIKRDDWHQGLLERGAWE